MNLIYSNKDSYQMPITQSGRCSYRLITTNNPSLKISNNYIDVSNENEPYPEANSISAWIKINGNISSYQNLIVNLFGKFGSNRCNAVQLFSESHGGLLLSTAQSSRCACSMARPQEQLGNERLSHWHEKFHWNESDEYNCQNKRNRCQK